MCLDEDANRGDDDGSVDIHCTNTGRDPGCSVGVDLQFVYDLFCGTGR